MDINHHLKPYILYGIHKSSDQGTILIS